MMKGVFGCGKPAPWRGTDLGSGGWHGPPRTCRSGPRYKQANHGRYNIQGKKTRGLGSVGVVVPDQGGASTEAIHPLAAAEIMTAELHFHGADSVRYWDVDTRLGTYRGPLRQADSTPSFLSSQGNNYKTTQNGNVLAFCSGS